MSNHRDNKTPVQIWFAQPEYKVVKQEAARLQLPISHYCKDQILEDALDSATKERISMSLYMRLYPNPSDGLEDGWKPCTGNSGWERPHPDFIAYTQQETRIRSLQELQLEWLHMQEHGLALNPGIQTPVQSKGDHD